MTAPTLTVRPAHWLVYVLSLGTLGHRFSPIGLGRVVTVWEERDVDITPPPLNPAFPPIMRLIETRRVATYTGDGPSIGWVIARLLAIYVQHDTDYRAGVPRRKADARARKALREAGGTLGALALIWWLVTPLLALAHRYRWGGFGDAPGWVQAIAYVLWCGPLWAVVGALIGRMG